MSEYARTLNLLDTILSDAINRGLLHCDAEDSRIDGHRVRVNGKDMLHFGSCSYLGLELDPRMKQSAIEATIRYGTQFSSSRAYISAPPYGLLEELLEGIFEAPVIVTPSTTMAHLSALPILVQDGDLMVLDHQVHHSVQMASQSLSLHGAKVELLRHGRLDELEEILCERRSDHGRIWYAIDGIYSMFGDHAPMAALHALLDRYDQFHLYVDDAHGMSWKGPHGRGHALAEHAIHPRMVMSTSLNKSFAAAGGVIIVPDAETKRRIRVCAGPLTFSGPVQPPMLGAAIASARIHLSDEVEILQKRLAAHIAECNALMLERDLPLISSADSPIRFLGVGHRKVAMNLGRRLADEGFFLNAAGFPAVPMRRCGLRFTLTLHQRHEDLVSLADAIERNFAAAFKEEGQDPEAVWDRLRLPKPQECGRLTRSGLECDSQIRDRLAVGSAGSQTEQVRLEHHHTIDAIPQSEWDACLGQFGASTWQGLRFLEHCFANREKPEERWRFSYFRLLDRSGDCLLATFFTQALWKDDMMAPAATSREIEERRASDPYLLTTQVLSMGSLLTEGEHLYLAPGLVPEQRDVLMRRLLKAVELEASREGAKTVLLRDFADDDPSRDQAMLDAGFIKQPAPDSFILEPRWKDDDDFLNNLTRRSRWHQRRAVLPWNDQYVMEVLGTAGRQPSRTEHERMRELYHNVKRGSLELNTFDLPDDFFEHVARDPSWEILALQPSSGKPGAGEIAGMLACFRGPDQYLPTVIGLDYRYVREYGLYRQCLRHAIERGRSHGVSRVHLGMGAALEKTRFGARAVQQCCYGQAEDHYGPEAIAQLTTQLQ